MDTLIVFCALIFAAAFLSLLSTFVSASYSRVTGQSRRPHSKGRARVAVDPFEPSDTQLMHFDPRMLQRTAPQTGVAIARPRGRITPRRPMLPRGTLTQRPQPLLAC